ncbi:hypothetical protein [Ammoniphilus resinae]|uniref:TMhelix containing protein n=1 Tax=Ammoniphilus resinae TaxID=861532 RepID=A0ABS4GX78_9BACL|nr:hypothetical protein [Ammoniphilus resinae]MBP1934873.1 hypothetical protein [Ammoniphilus resinae]
MNLESLIIKYTLGAVFVGVTLLFAGKVIVLVVSYLKIKGLSIITGEAVREWIFDAIWNGGKE